MAMQLCRTPNICRLLAAGHDLHQLQMSRITLSQVMPVRLRQFAPAAFARSHRPHR
jgi:hypothetical protein